MHATSFAVVDLTGTIFSGNEAGVGGGYNALLDVLTTMANCTFSKNLASSGAGVRLDAGATCAIMNSILWNNEDGSGLTYDAQVTLAAGGGASVSIASSDVMALPSCSGSGLPCENLCVDPMFVSADGADGVPGTEDDDLRLRPGSPCIDAADNELVSFDLLDVNEDTVDVSQLLPLDTAGAERFTDAPASDTGCLHPDPAFSMMPIVDMGAYEFALTADLNGDGVVDFGDVLIILASWGPCPAPPADCPGDLNGDGMVGFEDLLIVLSEYGS